MKRFVLALLCITILSYFSLSAVADDTSKKKDDTKAKQCKKECKKEKASKKEVKKEEAKKDNKKADKKEVKKDKTKKDEAKKDAKKTDPKKDAKKDEPKTIEVKKDDIHLSVKLKGVFEARKMTEIKVEPEQWGKFQILRVAEHGAKVSRGDLLVAFDPEDLDKAIADKRRSMAVARINMKKTEKEYETFKKLLPAKQQAIARAIKELNEDQQWDKKYIWKIEDEIPALENKISKYMVDTARAEYEQLKKMYEADDVTEETEEMILKRTKLMMEVAEFRYRYAKAEYEFGQKYGVARDKRDRQERQVSQKLALEERVALFPLAVQLKKLSMEKAKLDFQEMEKNFKELQADRKLMTVKAPCDGVVYYGFCSDGKWSGSSAGALEKDKTVSAKKPFMTIVNTELLQVCSSVSEKDLPLVHEGLKATARATVMPEKQLQLVVDKVDAIPSGSSFDVVLKMIGTAPERIVPGMSCDVKLIGFRKKDAVVVPATAIETDPLNDANQFVYRVDKKGKTQKVRVTTGKTVDKQVEILSGVKAGDKILPTPPKDEEKKK